jgi:hypothetical protein
VPLPVPLPLEVIIIQLSLLTAVQFVPAGAETFNTLSAPVIENAALLGENVVNAILAATFASIRPEPKTLLGVPLLLQEDALR